MPFLPLKIRFFGKFFVYLGITKIKNMAKKVNKFNPVVNEVIDRFDTVHTMTKSFVSSKYSALKGLLVSGDAGTGKTYWVKKAFIDAKATNRVEYIKGASISAAALYVKLYLNRGKGRVVVLDDCDIIHKSPAEKNAILDMLKGATDVTKGERMISWERASANQLMRENDVPMSFDFQGTVIWITNDTIEDIAKKVKNHWNAIGSRFNIIPVYLNTQEKLLYTIHLIEDCKMLGNNCEGKEGGYSKAVIDDTIDYIKSNYKSLHEITPRVATKIADIRENYPSKWKTLVANQIVKNG
jgi:hypothetical protein